VAERCNGQDDDCDGFVDEETTDCDDQIACTADSCEASGCHHVPDDSLCDDSNSCTDDSCDWQTGCAYRLMEGPPCDDGNPCTTGDTCDETGSCTGEPIADCCSEHLHCDDGNVCTTDRCEQGTCLSFPAPVGVTCDDGDPCTEQDGCFNGACSGVPISCDDSNPCTDDLCSGGSCSNTRSSDGQHCDDGDPCTTGDACSSGHCAGETTDCDDGEPCTADSCAGGGCIHGELPDGSSCPGGVCQGGSCRLTDGARLVAAGGEHSCAVRQSGAVLCWGSNASGQLGDGSTVLFRPAPSEPVSALEAPVALGAGTSHTCAVAADGAAHCWGSNATGQLGDPDAGFERRTPFPVLGLSDAASIDGGHEHTCARRRSGAIWCWGSDIHGRLGNGHHFTGEVHYTAVEVNNIWAATDVAAGGDHGCAAVNTGRVWCWGRNMHGEIGDGTSGGGAEHDFPVEVHELSSATAVATGHQHSCAAEADGTVWCWGRGMRGQIGHGGSGQLIGATTPHVATGVFDAIDVAAGQEHTCALTGGGQVWCWGAGTDGQIGDGGTTDRTYPTRVQSLPPTAALSVGRSHSCALARGGAVYCWGSNSSGQIGDGTSGGLRPLPVRVQGF